MAGYQIVKFCRSCKKRFIVQKGESHVNYCPSCESAAKKNTRR